LLCALAGKVVSAGAKPVADAAKVLKWDGDAAFELLGTPCFSGWSGWYATKRRWQGCCMTGERGAMIGYSLAVVVGL
jgi:hypothetical protein